MILKDWSEKLIWLLILGILYFFVISPMQKRNEQLQSQIEELLKVTSKIENKPTNAVPNIIIPALGGVNSIPPTSNAPVIISTLPANERVLAELIKKMNLGLSTSQIAAIVAGLIKPADKVKVGITDAKVTTESGIDDRLVKDITVKDLRENLTIVVKPGVKVLELEKPKSRIATCYTTSGNGLSYRFSESSKVPLLGTFALNGNILYADPDGLKPGVSIGKDIKGTMLEIQAGGCYNFGRKQPEIFVGGAVHF